jgi:leader peptidase (prepilin peptidase)/N-methyltransferase
LFLLLTVWQDIRRKEIDLWIFCVFGIAAAAVALDSVISGGKPGWQEYLAGGGFGVALFLLSRLTGGSIGAGDGLFFVVTGLMLGFGKCMLLFCGATFLSGIYSLCFYSYQRLRYNINVGKETLPFLPFAALTGLIMIWTGNI